MGSTERTRAVLVKQTHFPFPAAPAIERVTRWLVGFSAWTRVLVLDLRGEDTGLGNTGSPTTAFADLSKRPLEVLVGEDSVMRLRGEAGRMSTSLSAPSSPSWFEQIR